MSKKKSQKKKDRVFDNSSMKNSLLEMSKEKGIPVETLKKAIRGELSLEETSKLMSMAGIGVDVEDFEGNDYYQL
jgi:hypothetical protein